MEERATKRGATVKKVVACCIPPPLPLCLSSGRSNNLCSYCHKTMERFPRSTSLVLALVTALSIFPPPSVLRVDAKIPSPCSACGCLAEELQGRLDSEPVGRSSTLIFGSFISHPNQPTSHVCLHQFLERVHLQRALSSLVHVGQEPSGRSAHTADNWRL